MLCLWCLPLRMPHRASRIIEVKAPLLAALHPILYITEAVNHAVKDRHGDARILHQEGLEVDRFDHERLHGFDGSDVRRPTCPAQRCPLTGEVRAGSGPFLAAQQGHLAEETRRGHSWRPTNASGPMQRSERATVGSMRGESVSTREATVGAVTMSPSIKVADPVERVAS